MNFRLRTLAFRWIGEIDQLAARQASLSEDGASFFLRDPYGSVCVAPVNNLLGGQFFESPLWTGGCSHYFTSYDEQAVYDVNSSGRVEEIETFSRRHVRTITGVMQLQQYFAVTGQTNAVNPRDLPWMCFVDAHRLVGNHKNVVKFWQDDGTMVSEFTSATGDNLTWASASKANPTRFYLATYPNSQIEVWELERGQLIEEFHLPTGLPMVFDVGRDGNRLYVIADTSPKSIFVRDENTQQ